MNECVRMWILAVNKTLPVFGAHPQMTPRLVLSAGEGAGGNLP